MREITNRIMDEERALYGCQDTFVHHCRFEGPADGESALKECRNIRVENCFFGLRYPFWHNTVLAVNDCELTDKCRAALWYCERVVLKNTALHGIKALRECNSVTAENCNIVSPEFGWHTSGIIITDCRAESEYFLFESRDITANRLTLNGKYSFQYNENALFTDCRFHTKDAFWHSKNVTVKNSVIEGEYLGWYSDSLTLINCTIIGTQPFCYCKNLILKDCRMQNTDLCFEKSDVHATVNSSVDSIKNPLSGEITVLSVGTLIRDEEWAKGKVTEIHL